MEVLNDTLRTLHHILLPFPQSFRGVMLIHLKVITLCWCYIGGLHITLVFLVKGLSTVYVSGLSIALDSSGWKYLLISGMDFMLMDDLLQVQEVFLLNTSVFFVKSLRRSDI